MGHITKLHTYLQHFKKKMPETLRINLKVSLVEDYSIFTNAIII